MQRRNLLLAGTVSAGALGLAFLSRGRSVAEGMPSGHAFAVAHSEDEWRRMLTPAQYRVLRDHGTEPPFSSPLEHEKRAGTFCLRRLRPGPVRVHGQVRQRHRLAQLHRTARGRRWDERGP